MDITISPVTSKCIYHKGKKNLVTQHDVGASKLDIDLRCKIHKREESHHSQIVQSMKFIHPY